MAEKLISGLSPFRRTDDQPQTLYGAMKLYLEQQPLAQAGGTITLQTTGWYKQGGTLKQRA